MSSALYVDEGATAVANGRRAVARRTVRRCVSERTEGRHEEKMTRGVNVDMKAETSRGAAGFIAIGVSFLRSVTKLRDNV